MEYDFYANKLYLNRINTLTILFYIFAWEPAGKVTDLS